MKRTAMVALALAALGSGLLEAQSRSSGAARQGAQGSTVRVQMKQIGTRYVFEPANFTVRVGDVVEFINVNGFPHNVQFEPQRIPAGAAEVLNRNMPNRMGPLAGPMMLQPNQVYRVSFADAPAGTYDYFCLPHKPLGMTGTITVRAR